MNNLIRKGTSAKRLVTLGHRGMGDRFPHNSLQAFSEALKSSLNGIELDVMNSNFINWWLTLKQVWFTKDKVPVVFHGHSSYGDLNLRNISPPSSPLQGPVPSKFYKNKIKKIDYKHLLDMEEETINGVVPSLEVVLDLIQKELSPEQDFIINLEIKDSDPQICGAIIDQLIARKMENNVFFSSFHHFQKKNLEKALQSRGLQEKPFGYLTEFVQGLNQDEILNSFTDGDTFIVDVNNVIYDYEFIKDSIDSMKQKGLNFGIYFPVNDEMETKEYLDTLLNKYGVDLVVLNKPELAGTLCN